MGKIVYSFISNKDKEKFNTFTRKMGVDVDTYHLDESTFIAFAIDEDTGKIVLGVSINKDDNRYYLVDYYDRNEGFYGAEVLDDLIKIILNYAKYKGISVEYGCDTWDSYQRFHEMGFEFRDQDAYDRAMNTRDELLIRRKKCEELLNKSKNNKKNIKNEIEFIDNHLYYFYCRIVARGKKINEKFKVDGFKNFDELPKEWVDISYNKYEDPCVFKEDDNYKYCELRKTDQEYTYIKNTIAMDITTPNLRKNGGKLIAYMGLEFPELIVYLKDKKTDEIIAYVGLTENHGKGLYISQIAVREEYRKRGIGKILVNEAIRRANLKDIKYVSADILPDNNPSLALFSSFGFEEDESSYILSVPEYIKNHEYFDTEKKQK